MKPFHPLSTVDQLASHLRSEIFGGSFDKGLPGINHLASRLGCSPRTVIGAVQILLREGIVTRQGVGRPFLITPEKSHSPRGVRIQLMLYDREDNEQDMISQHHTQIRSHLENAGHVFSFASKSLRQLGMDVKRVARHVEKAEADAWIVSSGSHEVLKWFSEQPIPSYPTRHSGPATHLAGCHRPRCLLRLHPTNRGPHPLRLHTLGPSDHQMGRSRRHWQGRPAPDPDQSHFYRGRHHRSGSVGLTEEESVLVKAPPRAGGQTGIRDEGMIPPASS